MSHIDSVIGTTQVIWRIFGVAAINRTMGIANNGTVKQWDCQTKESPGLESFELYKESSDLLIITNNPCSSPPFTSHRLYQIFLFPPQQCLHLPHPPAIMPLPSRCSTVATLVSLPSLTRPTRPKMLVSGVKGSRNFW